MLATSSMHTLRRAGVHMSTELGTTLINAYCKGGSEGMRRAERILQVMLVILFQHCIAGHL